VRLLTSADDTTATLAAHHDQCTNRSVAGEHGVSQVTARQIKAIHDPPRLLLTSS